MRVPVRLLEHARFRLADAATQQGAGQGKGEPGTVLRPARPEQGDEGDAAGGSEEGELKLVLELKIDDIVDWLWDELKLPDLKPKRRPNRRRRARAACARAGTSAGCAPGSTGGGPSRKR